MSDATRDALDEFYKNLYKRTRTTGRAGGNRPWSKALASDALAVHPTQVKEAIEDARSKGVETHYLPDGRPVFRDRKHRKRYMQAYGYFDRDGGYGDAQQGGTRARDKEPEAPADYSHLTQGLFKEQIDYRGILR